MDPDEQDDGKELGEFGDGDEEDDDDDEEDFNFGDGNNEAQFEDMKVKRGKGGNKPTKEEAEEKKPLGENNKEGTLPRNHLIMNTQYKCANVRKIGQTEGGWNTCITPTLGENSVVYSFGLGNDPSFDLTFIKEFGGTVHAFDPTPTGEKCYNKSLHKSDKWVYHSWGLNDKDGDMTFLSPLGGHGQYSIKNWDGKYNEERKIIRPGYRLKTIMELLGHNKIDICKVDIEGSEWNVIDDLMQYNFNVDQLFFEFHFFDLDETDNYSEKLTRVISKLNSKGFRWFHRNNFRTLGKKQGKPYHYVEYSFIYAGKSEN